MAKGGNQRRRLEAKREAERRARKKAHQRRRAMTSLIGAVLVILLVMGSMAIFKGGKDDASLAKDPTPTPTPSSQCVGEPKPAYKNPPPADATKKGATYTATFDTTKGTIVVDLLEKEAPKTVNNFVFLARDGFYDNSLFHRVIPDFGGPGSDMIQGGDATSCNGTGSPGYAFDDENLVPMKRKGLLAMANSGPKTNGSQFFLLNGAVGHLNEKGKCPGPQGCHSVFGYVTDGLDVINAIATVPQGQSNRPVENVIIKTITIKES